MGIQGTAIHQGHQRWEMDFKASPLSCLPYITCFPWPLETPVPQLILLLLEVTSFLFVQIHTQQEGVVLLR